MDFAVPADHRVKWKESEEKDKYLDLARKLKKKLWNMKVTIIPIVIGGDYPNSCIIKIGQNTEKSPGDLRRHAVT